MGATAHTVAGESAAGEAVIMANYGFCLGHFDLLWVVTHNTCGLQVIAVKHVATRVWPIMAKK
jgi:hypothetical protein